MKRSDAPPPREQALSVLKTAMVEKKLTQFQLADAADCHEKTIQNLLAGRSVREQTLFDVCMVLDVDYETIKIPWNGGTTNGGTANSGTPNGGITGAPRDPKSGTDSGGSGGSWPRTSDATRGSASNNDAVSATAARDVIGIAPLYMGGYTRRAVDHYIGSYLTIRPSLDGSTDIVAFRTKIFWSDLAQALCFAEQDRPDAAYSHRGHLYIPSSSMFIHLVSLTKGAMRMVLISQIDQFGIMRGIITTLNKAIGAAFTPVAAPIVYELHENFDDISFGTISTDHAAYQRYKTLLDDTLAQSYVRLVGQPG